MLLLIMQGLAAAALGAPAELEKVSREFAVPQYTQELTVKFASPEAAARAGIRIAPLFEGRERAISCRWDDNHPGTVGARDRMNAHGIKGTYYLHGTEGDYHFAGDFMPIAKQLFEGGHSVGGHGLTHPYLTYVNRNRMFEEVMGIRIFWESQLDTTLNSYTFSFVNYRSEAEGDLVQRDITHCLERAGFYHVATFKTFDDHLKTDLLFSIIMPPENQDLEAFKQGVDWAESSEDLKERFPLISNSMHPWYDSPNLPQYGWDELDRRLDYLGRNPDHWRANQNEYAAYWAQSRLGRIEVTGREGDTVRLRLTRPTLDYLNDATPVTVQVEGVAPARSGLVHLCHGRDRAGRAGASRHGSVQRGPRPRPGPARAGCRGGQPGERRQPGGGCRHGRLSRPPGAAELRGAGAQPETAQRNQRRPGGPPYPGTPASGVGPARPG